MIFKSKDIKRQVFLIFCGIFIWWMFTNVKFIMKYIGLFVGALSPLIVGFIISFILNKPMIFFEKKLFSHFKIKDKYKRILSLVLTIIIFLIIIIILIYIIIPSLIDTGIEISDKFPDYMNTLEKYVKNGTIKYSKLNQWIERINIEDIQDEIYNFINGFVKGGLFNWIGSTFSIASSVFGGIISFFLGMVFSVYFLLEKEKLIENLKDFLSTVLPGGIYSKMIYLGRITNKSFSDFILAQSLESIVLGSLFFILLILFKFPYPTMISVVIAVSSVIPIVGSFLGLLVGVILIFVESPKLAGLFIILFLVLQQVEGNIIYPRVVGKLSGLSPLFTLAAVTIGGSLMGIVGIIIFVPIFSIIKKILSDYIETKKLVN